MWRADGPQGHESDKIAHLIVPYTRGDVLDIGSGDRSPWPHFIGVDSGKQWGKRVAMIHGDGSDLSKFGDASWDAVFSSHFLEHTVDYKAALREWWRVLKPGGHLVMYLPDKRYYPNIGQFGANPDHKWDFLPDDIIAAMKEIGKESGWTCLENEVRTRGDEYSFFLVLKKRDDSTIQFAQWEKPERTALVCRYGGIGDHIMAASILPHLKAEGYHVTYMTTPLGRDVMLHNPHIDAFWVQDPDQVPNHELGPYWKALEQEGRWDRFIQLSESIERGLLLAPNQISHAYPHDARHRLFNVNYLERTHDIAGVPHVFHQKFHPSREETETAEAFRDSFGRKVVYWPLVGSSVHKWYPWVPEVCRWLIEKSDCQIVLTSDPTKGKDMADDIMGALRRNGVPLDRLVCMAGEWDVRQSLTFATVADVLVGPETGVTNAGAMEPNRKVVFLSHSSVENLTKHWVNTVSLTPQATPCYPCHKLHYSAETCQIDAQTSAAMCAADIAPIETFRAVMDALSSEIREAAE